MKELKSSLLREYFLLIHCEYHPLPNKQLYSSLILDLDPDTYCFDKLILKTHCIGLIYDPPYRKKQDEESITVHEVAPASAVPCPPLTKTLRRKLGDFFTLKKRRGLKSEPSQEGRPKKASIADFIRPLREVARAEKEKEKDRVKEHDKENEKEKAKEHPSALTGESAVQETPVSGAPPLRGEAVPPRRALREGKSQSLILLSGSAAGTTNARNTAKVSAGRV